MSDDRQLYILTGKLFCGICGAPMSGTSRLGGRDRKSRYSEYICANRRQKKCDNKPIRKETIENEVLDRIESFYNPDKIADRIMELSDTQGKDAREKLIEYIKVNQGIIVDRSNLLECRSVVEAHIKKIVLSKEDMEIIYKIPV